MKVEIARLTSVCISLILTSLFLTGISAAIIDPETIVGMWMMDEGDGDQAGDSSGNGHDGEIQGGVEWIDGVFGQALAFDGSGHVNAGNVPLPQNEVTVVLWASVETSQQWIHLIENGVVENTWNGGFRLELGGEGVAYIGIGDGTGFTDNAGNGVPTGWTYGEWFHWAFTYDGETARHYQDGEESHTFNSSMDITNGVGTLILGSMQGSDRFLQGSLDDVAIFNVVLGEDEIKTIMNKGLQGAFAVFPLGKLPIAWGEIKDGEI